jgi:hypothetical protein
MSIINRVKNIITDPKIEWEKIDLEPTTMQSVLTNYVAPLSGISALCTFIGVSVSSHASAGLGLKAAIATFIIQVASIAITAYVVDALAPSFNSHKNITKSTKLIAYGATPALVGSFLSVIPSLAVVGSLFGLYGIYLIYLGLGPLKGTPEDKKILYLLVSVLALVIIYVVLNRIFISVLF